MGLQQSLRAERVAGGGRQRLDVRDVLARYGTFIALILLIVVAALLSPRFLSPVNLMNVLRQTAIVGVLGIGMTFVILTAGIDLSVGATLALSAVLLAGTLESTGNILLAMLVAVLAGMAVGLGNGLGVTLGRVQPFVMTLGMLGIARSLAFLYTGGQPIPVLDRDFLMLGIGYLWKVPIPSVIFIAILIVAALVLRYTPFGRAVYAIGSNEEAARLSGIEVGRVKTAVYIISGFTAGVGAIMYCSQFASAPAIAGEGYELDAIAAVVVGGTSLFGGQGGVIGTFFGALIILAVLIVGRGRRA